MKSTTFAALALMTASAMAGAGGRTMNGVSEQVHVETAGGRAIVRLAVENHSKQPVYVPKAVYEDDELIAPVFDIREAGTDRQIEYIGRKVKRGPITKDDYVQVKPGAKKTNSIDITSSYDFLAGEHTYKLTFPGSIVTDLAQLDVPTRLPVMPVSFVFRK
ncbi:hypothetical protein HHL21_19095 [Massilia sp. RP-1-19]|uniref:Uncharacterized protein n=1 Tax=Massilia polaris TaxID=2728846 RepID=A0A848HSX8_9BURK|nr:hypothetical protein [Massilia polaris]NML63149.1 hypothetical protein [Massilia polaris]